jgi:hypothetical protein
MNRILLVGGLLAACGPAPGGYGPASVDGGAPAASPTPSPADPSPSPSASAGDGGATNTPVSFSGAVIPIFEKRACQSCHSGNGIGKDLGNLTLDGSAQLMYRELTKEISPDFMTVRVNLKAPEQSLLLTLPGPEPDKHPVTIWEHTDPDYLTILNWIREGAQQN